MVRALSEVGRGFAGRLRQLNLRVAGSSTRGFRDGALRCDSLMQARADGAAAFLQRLGNRAVRVAERDGAHARP